MSIIVEVTTHTHFPIKLTSNNFLIWRKQVLATLIGLGLDSYIDGSVEALSKFLPNDITKPNPAYLPWFRQDQILLGALLGICSDTIQPIVSSAETSRQAFKHLTDSYASASRYRIISLKSRLANNPKSARPISEFLHEMKTIADELALTQSPIDEEDPIVHILGQLGDDYTHISAALKFSDTQLVFLICLINLWIMRGRSKSHSNRYTPRYNNDTRYTNRSNNSGSRPSRYQGQQSGNSFPQRSNRNPTFCQYCHIPGHDTKECRKLARFLKENNITLSMTSPTNPTVNISSARPSSPTPPWMFDSGASQHVASNPSSLHTISEYDGPDEIVLGNGKSLSISHVGNTTLSTQSRSLNLQNVLFVPQLRNNLVSVAKLCKSNNVSVEFFPIISWLRTYTWGRISCGE